MTSIYRRICEEYRKRRSIPYDFMPPDIGASNVAALRGNSMSPVFREVCARKTWKAAWGEDTWSVIEVVWFAREFSALVRKKIESGEITADETARQGMKLCMDSDKTQAVEAGIIMMGARRDDLTAQVMERLALHSKFTLLAIIACRDWPEPNARIFRWLQRTADCGAVVCAAMLKLENDDQRRWLFENGLRVGRPRGEMAKCMLSRPSMAEFIRRLPDTPENFHHLCRLVSYAPEVSPEEIRWIAVKLMRGMEFADQYIDLCAIHRVQRTLLDPTDDLYPQWEAMCDPVRWKLRKRGVIEREMDDPQESAALLTLVLTGEKMTPPLERLQVMMSVESLPEELLRFLLGYHGEIYAEELLKLMLRAAPPALFDAPTKRDPREFADGQYDVWLAAALGMMSGSPVLQEEQVIRCLGGRSVPVRAQAIRCIQVMSRDGLSEEMELALRRAIAEEPEELLCHQMKRLQGGLNPAERTRHRVRLPWEIDPEALRSCQLSGKMGYQEILHIGTLYDADGLRNIVAEGERLLLCAMEGETDRAAVATVGGMALGEIDLQLCEPEAAKALAAGEILVALLDDALYVPHPFVEIRRPLRPLNLPVDDKIRAFPMFRR